MTTRTLPLNRRLLALAWPVLPLAGATLMALSAGHAKASEVVVAQVFDGAAGVKTSPARKMEVGAGGGSGAPHGVEAPAKAEAGGHGEEKPAAGHGAKPVKTSAKAAAGGHGAEAAAEPAAEASGQGEAKPAARAAKPARAGARTAQAEGESLGALRQRLAEKLGAKPAPDSRNPYMLRVSNQAESGEVVGSGHGRAGASASARAAAIIGGHAPAGAPTNAAAAAAAMADPHAAHAAGHGGAVHWDYAGEYGPESWGQMKPEFAACASGKRQSPIDIRGGIQVDLDPIRFDYRASGFSVLDNGHTIQVNVAPGNSITVGGRRFDLVQFHFHRPSEERINGRQFDMVAHLVHKDIDGKLAVVGVLLDRGSIHPLIQTVWNNLPLEKGEESPAVNASLDLNKLLPEDRRYYTYMGSLTTPPCSEGVLWMVMKQPVQLSAEQVAIFAKLYPMNARPIQQASGRLIKESN